MGPAPPVAAVRAAVRAALRQVAGPVLVACSGGADSLALAAATAFEARRAGLPAGLVTVDHGLVPGSAPQAVWTAATGAELGLSPVTIVRVAVGSGGGPEAAARTARYAALDELAERLDAMVLLGHTLDDQAETVLLGLGRGSGPRSIAGMAAADGRYLRPLLAVRRATTVAACAALGMYPWQDPHNADPAFQRPRLRHQVLPLLEQVLQGGVAPALARTAELLRDDLAALDGWAAAALHAAVTPVPAGPVVAIRGGHPNGTPQPRSAAVVSVAGPVSPGPDRDRRDETVRAGLSVAALADLPRAVRTRVLRAWAAAEGTASLSAERTAALDALITDWHGQGAVDLPGGVAVMRASGTLVAYARGTDPPTDAPLAVPDRPAGVTCPSSIPTSTRS